MARSRPGERGSVRDPTPCAAPRRPPGRAVALASAVATVALASGGAGCAASQQRSETVAKDRSDKVTTTATAPSPTVRHSTVSNAPAGKPLSVRLRVVSGPGGVFAFADVVIDGKGPFAFTVDTGASRSVIDWDVVERVGIETVGKPVEITGITCRGRAGKVRLRRWRAGDVRLPRAEIQTVDMPEPPDGTAIDGLLGSDVLSRFGSITVDYARERLLLARRASGA